MANRKPPNPQGVPKSHGKKPSNPQNAPKSHGRKPPAPAAHTSSGKSSSSASPAVVGGLTLLYGLPVAGMVFVAGFIAHGNGWL